VSSVTVYDELLRRRPDLVDRLYEPVALDRRDEGHSGPGWVPAIPCRWDGARLRTLFNGLEWILRRLPTAPLTGCFVAVDCVRRG